MSRTFEELADQVRRRAEALRPLVDAHGVHPKVADELKHTYGALLGCEDYAREPALLLHEHLKELDSQEESKRLGHTIATAELTRALKGSALLNLNKALELIASERDREAQKELLKATGEAGLKIGLSLVHAEVLKSLKELAEAGLELYRAGESLKFRAKQVELASDLIAWLETASTVSLNWCVAAEQFLPQTAAQGALPHDKLLERVNQRIEVLWDRTHGKSS